MIKTYFSKGMPKDEKRSKVRIKRGDRGIWQRRFWKYYIRDDQDYENHFDYLHFNPVKHGWVGNVIDWPFSSFHRYIEKGIYPKKWVSDKPIDLLMSECRMEKRQRIPSF